MRFRVIAVFVMSCALAFEAKAGEAELLPELDKCESVSGASVGFGGVKSRFFEVYEQFAALGDDDLPERLLGHSSPVRRSMGLLLLVRRDGDRAVPTLLARIDDRAPITVNPGGCVYEWGSVGRVARWLLGNRNSFTEDWEWVPMLAPEDLLALDVEILSRDSAARIHDRVAGDVLDAIEEKRLPLDLEALGKRYPRIPPVRLVKAIGRLRNERYFGDAQLEVTRWVTELARDSSLPDGVRLAAASALCRPLWREDETLSKPLPEGVLAGLPEEAKATILRDRANALDLARKGRESAVFQRGHVLVVLKLAGKFDDIEDYLEGKFLDPEDYPAGTFSLGDRYRLALFRVLERLDEWQPAWSSFGDGLYLLWSAVHQHRKALVRELDREDLLRLLSRLHRLTVSDDD